MMLNSIKRKIIIYGFFFTAVCKPLYINAEVLIGPKIGFPFGIGGEVSVIFDNQIGISTGFFYLPLK